jgi:hypothetical protein
MGRTLEKNMAKLPDGVINSDFNDLKERVKQCMDPALQYACSSWHTHLICGRSPSVKTLEITSALYMFLEGNFLFRLEVLSILGGARKAVDALQAAVDWLEVCPDFIVNLLLKIPNIQYRNHPHSISSMTVLAL